MYRLHIINATINGFLFQFTYHLFVISISGFYQCTLVVEISDPWDSRDSKNTDEMLNMHIKYNALKYTNILCLLHFCA